MNKLNAKIINIESADHISLVDLEKNGDIFSCVVIETPETAAYLTIGNKVHILFKETEVSIAKGEPFNISLRNRLQTKIKEIEKGKILSKIILAYQDTEIISVITTRSVKKLDLKPGDMVVGLIKANEVSILSDER